uniref:Uncharacterized protein n=1 Tax=Anguilla anguilla TaxID=7936 RepID=A0A0E9TQH5_ANGAN
MCHTVDLDTTVKMCHDPNRISRYISC